MKVKLQFPFIVVQLKRFSCMYVAYRYALETYQYFQCLTKVLVSALYSLWFLLLQ